MSSKHITVQEAYQTHTLRLLGDLGERLVQSDPEKLQQFSRKCASYALLKSSLVDETLKLALELPPSLDLIKKIQKIVVSLDEIGFNLRDAYEDHKATLDDYLLAFSKARAADSVLALLSETDPLSMAAHVAYEARAAIGKEEFHIFANTVLSEK